MVFPTFFNWSLNLAIRSSWSEPQSAPGLVFPDCIELLHLWLQKYNQSDFSVDHLVMSMYRVFSCVVGRGCLLSPVHFLGKTLLAFALLHSVFQGQICLLWSTGEGNGKPLQYSCLENPMNSVFSWRNSISLCPASFHTPSQIYLLLQMFLDFLLLHFSPL